MDDQPAKKRDWAIVFLGRLCLIGWVCAILYEAFDFLKPMRQICLFFGPWACVIALLNGLALLLIRRQGIFLVFVLIAIPPTIHFGFILRNIAIEKKLIDPHEFGGHTEKGRKDDISERKFSR
jgi:hypothetical protein